MASSSDRYQVKPKRHHGYAAFIFLIGFLLPPFAVAARFGIGKDFWINVVLTICGWVPGQIHNFYIQTVRNNKNAKRTPQWAVRHGLVDDSTIKRHKKRSQWSHRYNDRLPQSALDGAEFAPGQIPDAPANADAQSPNQASSRRASTIGGARSPAALWREEDSEGFYDRTKVEPTRGHKSRKNSGWRFDGGFPDEDATTGLGGSIYTEPERRPRKKRSTKHNRQSSIDSPTYGSRVGSRVWEDPLSADGEIMQRTTSSTQAANKTAGDGLHHEF